MNAVVDDVGAKRWVTQCALSRICGICAEPLGRPVAFLGTPDEVARNAFHLPPMHAGCADAHRRTTADGRARELVLTAGFEFVRPAKQDQDRRPTFQPNSLLSPGSVVEQEVR